MNEGKSEESLDWSLHGGGGKLCVLGVDTAGALRDHRLAPGSHLAEARGLLQSLHHGLLTDCGQEDENTLRDERYFSAQFRYDKLTDSRFGRSRII